LKKDKSTTWYYSLKKSLLSRRFENTFKVSIRVLNVKKINRITSEKQKITIRQVKKSSEILKVVSGVFAIFLKTKVALEIF